MRSGSFPTKPCRRGAIATISRKRSKLGPGQIYVSPLDLGRRNGVIEEAHRPTLRVATPIIDDDGKPFGIFMINVDMRRAFDRVRSSVWPGEAIYVVNRAATISFIRIVRANSAALLGKPTDWKADFPHLAALAGTTQASAEIVPDQAAQPGGIALRARASGRRRMGRRHRDQRPTP